MKRFSILHVPVLSFFSKRLYCDVALQWRGTGFGYLLLLLAVTWVPVMIHLQMRFSDFVAHDAPKLIAQVPHFSIHHGKASITEPQPYFVKNPDSNATFAIIDTTGTITSLKNTPAKVLVTQTEAIVRKNESETQTFSFAEIDDFTLGPKEVKSWLDTFHRYMVVALYPAALIGSYAYRIVQALIYALFGLAFAAAWRAKIGYSALLRLAIVAVTPCIVIDTVLDVANVSLSYAGLWYFLATMAYLCFGVAAVSHEPPPVSPEIAETPGGEAAC